MKTPRGARGALAALIILAIVFAGFVIAAIGVDSYHVHVIRSELQNACDAAALAGAQDLWEHFDLAESDAYRFAALNKVEGVSIANGEPGITVNVVAVAPPSPTAGTGTATQGTVTVTATKQISHLFARIFGRGGDIIQARAVAGARGKLWRIGSGKLFPIAVSLDAIPEGGLKLADLKLGDTLILDIKTNACFTSLTKEPCNASLVKTILDAALSNPVPTGVIPGCQLGANINLINGQLSNIKWSDYEVQVAGKQYIVIPVVTGTPAYNQTRKVVGFIALKTVKPTGTPNPNVIITGTLVNPAVVGESGPPILTGIPGDDNALDRLELSAITLLQ